MPRTQDDVAAPRSRSARYLLLALIGTLGLFLVALALAAYLESPYWLDALWACAALLGMSAALAGALALSLLIPNHWRISSAIGLAIASAATRWVVLQAIASRSSPQPRIDIPPPRIDLLQIWLAASSVVWGALALVWAVQTVSDALENPAYSKRIGLVRTLGGAAAVALSLHSLTPLWTLFGLRLNVWTLVGLIGLALTAFLLDRALQRIGRWIGSR